MLSKNLLSLSDLSERGWTKKMIDTLLGPPDETRPNPRYRCAADMRIYYLSRVVAAEASAEFAAALDKSAGQKAGAAKAIITKREKLMSWVENRKIAVPLVKDLYARACEHYNDLSISRGKYDSNADPTRSDDSFLHRIAVNYLRHEMTDYNALLNATFGHVGVSNAQDALREKVYNAIASAYPDLQSECDRQVDKRLYAKDEARRWRELMPR